MSETFQVDIDELAEIVKEKITAEEVRDFNDIVDFSQSINDRVIFLSAIVDGTGYYVDRLIRYWNKVDDKNNIPIEERQPIKIYIDSMGGSMCDTLTMVDSIKLSKTPVWTIVVCAAYSGGFFTFIAGHKRIAYPHASFLYHEGATGTSGTAAQFENYTAFYKRQLNQLKQIVLENTNITEEEYKDIKKDDVWYTAEDGVEKGFVDEIAKEFV